MIDQIQCASPPAIRFDTGNCPPVSTGNRPNDIRAPVRDTARTMRPVEILHRNIQRLLTERSMTARDASLAATGKEDPIRDIARGRMPNGERLAQIAEYFGTTSTALLSLDGVTDATAADVKVAPHQGRGTIDLPILGTALGHSLEFDTAGGIDIEQTIFEPGEVIRFIPRPAILAGAKEAYALYIQGDSMIYRFEPGDLAVVDPRKTPQLGDDVIVQLTGDPDSADRDRVVSVLIKRLVRRSASWIELKQFNPEVQFRVESSRVRSVHRIVRMGDLFGA